MRPIRQFSLLAGLWLACTPGYGQTNPSSANSGQFDVKTGLWDVTIQVSISTGDLQNTDAVKAALERMTPQQRAQYLAALDAQQKKNQAATAKPTVKQGKWCLTEDDLNHGTIMGMSTGCSDGRRVTNTGEKIALRCPAVGGDANSELNYDFERIDAEHFKGTIESLRHGPNAYGYRQSLTFAWLRASCGNAPASKPGTAGAEGAGAGAAASPSGLNPGDAHLIRLGNDYYVKVVNRTSVPMSGYVVGIVMYGSGEKIRHFYDARMVGRPPIKPGAGQQERHGGIVVGATLLGAVFTDGSSFGNANEVRDLMERREVKISTLGKIARELCDARRKGTDLQSVVGRLESERQSALNTGTAMLSSIREEEYRRYIDEVKGVSLRGGDATGQALESIEKEGTALFEDPVKDANGQQYLKETPAVLTCGADLGAGPAHGPKPYSAHPMITLREGYYVRNGLPTDRWPAKQERVLRVRVSGDDITIVEFLRNVPSGAAQKERVIFHGTYVSNPFEGEWGTSHGKMPMSILSPERFLFGSEGSSTSSWNRLRDNAAGQ